GAVLPSQVLLTAGRETRARRSAAAPHGWSQGPLSGGRPPTVRRPTKRLRSYVRSYPAPGTIACHAGFPSSAPPAAGSPPPAPSGPRQWPRQPAQGRSEAPARRKIPRLERQKAVLSPRPGSVVSCLYLLGQLR